MSRLLCPASAPCVRSDAPHLFRLRHTHSPSHERACGSQQVREPPPFWPSDLSSCHPLSSRPSPPASRHMLMPPSAVPHHTELPAAPLALGAVGGAGTDSRHCTAAWQWPLLAMGSPSSVQLLTCHVAPRDMGEHLWSRAHS